MNVDDERDLSERIYNQDVPPPGVDAAFSRDLEAIVARATERQRPIGSRRRGSWPNISNCTWMDCPSRSGRRRTPNS